MLELALGVPPRQGVGRREGGGESIRALLPRPERREVQPYQVPGGGEEPLGKARVLPGLGEWCRLLATSDSESIGPRLPGRPRPTLPFSPSPFCSREPSPPGASSRCGPACGLLWSQQSASDNRNLIGVRGGSNMLGDERWTQGPESLPAPTPGSVPGRPWHPGRMYDFAKLYDL